ncbi:MAG: DNA double-strand break repair nuclease NurA [Candidatus Bathyarchaeia archaeon]
MDLSNISMNNFGEKSLLNRIDQLTFEIGFDDEVYSEPQFSFDFEDFKSINLKPIKLIPLENDSSIVGIDVSSIKIGELNDGILCAVRGAIVWKEKIDYHYLKCGPLIFYINEKTFKSFLEILEPPKVIISSNPLSIRILSKLRNFLERWIQSQVCSSFKDSIILFDGSLATNILDSPVEHLEEILSIARKNKNIVLAFSKSTKLCFQGKKITRLAEGLNPPYLIDVDDLILNQTSSYPIKLLGKIYIANLTQGGFAFRLDIDGKVSIEEGILAVEKLIYRDLIDNGYPEVLKLAHVLSTFTANEVIGIQGYITKKYGLKTFLRMNFRRSLFGPYGSSVTTE